MDIESPFLHSLTAGPAWLPIAGPYFSSLAGRESQVEMESVSRPLPELRNAGAEYWRAAARGTLAIPTCRACSRAFWHPRPHCPHCGSDDVELVAGKGTGIVHTFTVVRQSADPFFKSKVPYVVAMIRLDEGISMMSNVVDCNVDAVRIGMPVEVMFEPAAGDIAIPVFRIAT